MNNPCIILNKSASAISDSDKNSVSRKRIECIAELNQEGSDSSQISSQPRGKSSIEVTRFQREFKVPQLTLKPTLGPEVHELFSESNFEKYSGVSSDSKEM